MKINYQVFNPLTGLHTEYQNEEEARVAVCEISKQIIEIYKPTVCKTIPNENGDSTWIPVDFMAEMKVGF